MKRSKKSLALTGALLVGLAMPLSSFAHDSYRHHGYSSRDYGNYLDELGRIIYGRHIEHRYYKKSKHYSRKHARHHRRHHKHAHRDRHHSDFKHHQAHRDRHHAKRKHRNDHRDRHDKRSEHRGHRH